MERIAEFTFLGGRRRRRRRTWQEVARRLLNIGVAALGLVLTAPLMLVIALLIKLTSPGPVIFSQFRVGLDRRRGRDSSRGDCRRNGDAGGRLFRIYKFRTMTVQDDDAPQIWATPEDPRITPVGRFLRKYRLDELPQLVNVLRGDMNVVGPRPEQPEIFQQIRGRLAEYPRRQAVRPGITGLAQVNNGYDLSMDDVSEKLRYDIEYLERRSPLLDLKIMVRTIPVMIFKFGSV